MTVPTVSCLFLSVISLFTYPSFLAAPSSAILSFVFQNQRVLPACVLWSPVLVIWVFVHPRSLNALFFAACSYVWNIQNVTQMRRDTGSSLLKRRRNRVDIWTQGDGLVIGAAWITLFETQEHLCGSLLLSGWAGGMGGRLKREGIYVCLQLIHCAIQQKLIL